MLAYLGFSHPLLVHLCALSARFLKNLGRFDKNKGTFSENKGRNERKSAGFSTGIPTGIGAPRRCAFSSATAHKHKTNSHSPSCFFNAGAGQRLKRSAWPVHFDEAGLVSSPHLVARHGAYRLLRHIFMGFFPNGKPKTKKTLSLCDKFAIKKIKQLSLQRNDSRSSRSRAMQHFLVCARAFFGAVSPSGSPSRVRAPQETAHTPGKRNARIRCASTKK